MDLKICENLVRTYNVNVFNEVDSDIQEAFYKEAITSLKDIEIDDNKRYVLLKLIDNHYNPSMKKPTPKFIGGPKNLTVHWSPKYQKIICIFGEKHTKIMNCEEMFGDEAKGEFDVPGSNKMSIEYFLIELLRTTDAFIDIYAEIIGTGKKKKGYHESFSFSYSENRLKKLFDTFKDCIQYETRGHVKCRLSRIHFIDIRGQDKDGKKEETSLLGFLGIKMLTIYNTNFTEEGLKQSFIRFIINNESIQIALSVMIQPNEEIFKRFFIDQLYSSEYISREKVPELIKKFIEDKFIKKVMESRDIFIKLIPLLFNIDTDPSIYAKAFEDVNVPILLIDAYMMDLYLLVRLFKKFDMNYIEEKGYIGATDQPERAHNIIIYAGDQHSSTYREFLRNLNFEVIAKTGVFDSDEKTYTCINMDTIKQPLFSEWPPKKYKIPSETDEFEHFYEDKAKNQLGEDATLKEINELVQIWHDQLESTKEREFDQQITVNKCIEKKR